MNQLLATWSRRILVVTIYVALLAALLGFAVPLLLAAALADAVRRQPWTATRTLVFFAWYLLCELAGIAASLLLWLGGGPWRGGNADLYQHRNFELQNWWTRMLGRGAFRVFDIELAAPEVQVVGGGDYRFGERPILLFVRHASTADTILASLLLAVPYGMHFRYVLKRELLWDPCLDIVGNRLPNVFVRRDSAQTATEVAAVAKLADNLRAGEGVLIYPEGTRFSQSKRRRIVEKLRGEGREREAAEAEALQHVLRPRSGGPLALLEAAPDTDVVFLAHTGFEGSASFDRFFNGGLIGKVVRTELRVVRAADVPRDADQRRRWLLEQWQQVDRFVSRWNPPGQG